jgi:two-component system, NarL family, invasion response regulator UvrY
VRIAVADDHMIVRRGMQLIIAKRPGWTITIEAATASDLFECLRQAPVDVVVLDLMLRGRSGLDILAQVRREYPSIPVLILSSSPEVESALTAIRAGARGYVQKDSSADEILDAIARVASGKTWVSAAVADQMATEIMNPTAREPHELLSARELEVFHFIARGVSMTDIAATLGISVKTASTYRTRILEKTGFRSNADIVVYAVRAKLI